MGDRKRIAVLGAGPKAAAIAAWVHAWEQTRALVAHSHLPQAPEVVVLEPEPRGGAAWIGNTIGYSDGTPELCTPDDADVTNRAGGFLVHASQTAADVAQLLSLLAPFAWPRITTTHQSFGDYVDDVLTRSAGPDVRLSFSTEVTKIEPDPVNGWRVTLRTAGTTKPELFDGVVITGPGEPRPPIPGTSSLTPGRLVFDTRDYWRPNRTQRVQTAERVVRSSDGSPRIAIAGTGGAAAAIALDICETFDAAYANLFPKRPSDEGHGLTIRLIAPRAGLLTRGESEWETRVLREQSVWDLLSARLRGEALDHLVGGVVFGSVLNDLERWLAPSPKRLSVVIEVEPGKAISIDDDGDTSWGLMPTSAPLRLVVRRDRGDVIVHEANLFVNAIGFDNQSFMNLLAPSALVATLRAVAPSELLDVALAVDLRLQNGVGGSASVAPCLRTFHLPMFTGGSQAPGFGSLLALGNMAERILSRYF